MLLLKKYIFIALSMIMVCPILFAQNPKDTLNRKDVNGLKQGSWQKRYESGMIQYEGSFVDDKPVGTFKYYYPEGTTKAITSFEKNSNQSYSTIFAKNGKKMAEGNYIGQLKDSSWKYYSESGNLVSTENYKKGLKNGMSVTWYENGLTADSKQYINDTLDGSWKMYYDDQSVKSEGIYKKGLLEGEFKAWHSTGRLFVSGTYNGSLREGEWSIYNKEGTLIRIEEFSKGELINKKIIIPEEEDIDKQIKVDLIPE